MKDINIALREIIETEVNTMETHCVARVERINQAISQIKALVIESLKIIYKRRYPEFDSANLKNGQIAVMNYVKEMMDKWQL